MLNHIKYRDVSLAQLEILASLPRFDTLRGMARDLGMSPSQLSKIVASSEEQFKIQIINRSSTGIVLTLEGQKLCQELRGLLNTFNEIEVSVQTENQSLLKHINIGSRGFLNAIIAPVLVNSLEEYNYAGKFVDLSPLETMAAARAGSIEAAVTIKQLDLGKSWVHFEIGKLKWVIYTHIDSMPFDKIIADSALPLDFIGHVSWDGRVLITPPAVLNHPSKNVQINHRAQTVFVIQSILKNRKNVFAFLPEKIKSMGFDMADLRREECAEQYSFTDNMFLSVNSDRVSQKILEILKSVVVNEFQ